MYFFKKIALSVFAFWCLVSFCVMLFLTYLRLVWCFYIVPTKANFYKAHFIAPWVSKWLLRLWGVRCVIDGEQHIDATQHYIVVLNHSSDLDPFLGSYVFKKLFVKYLGKAEVLKYPIFGLALRKMYIPVQRNNRNSREQVMQLMIKSVKTNQCSLFIYPEGTRNRGPQLLTEFHDGAFKVAIATQTPILVATFVNSFKIMRPRSWLIYPQKLQVEVAAPLSTIGLTMANVPEVKAQVRAIMLAAFAKHGVEHLI